jgi:hypothetical protein
MQRLLGALCAGLALLSARPAAAEQVHLTWFMWSGTEPEVVAWKHVAELVTQKYPDIIVEFQTTSFPDYWTKLPALAAGHKLPDIVSLQSLRSPGFADLMVPLDERIKADAFDPSIVKGLSRNGKQFALPYDFGPWVIYYNRDMFERAGVPLPQPGWTEADFMRDARALTKDGAFGFAVSEPDAFMVFARSKGRAVSRCEGSARPEQRGHEERVRAIRRPGQQGEGCAVAAREWRAVVFCCQRPLHLGQCRHVRRWALAGAQHQEEGELHCRHGAGPGT